MTSFYRHSSLGKLNVTGEVTQIITAQGSLEDYGEAIIGQSDKGARELVVQALLQVRQLHADDAWWDSFDNWDLNDYDLDNNRREPDGFIDAVVLIYAGKPQSSCQASFDSDRTRPASADVPPGPRQAASVECYNRIWPHRWSIAIAKDDPRFSEVGPEIEGTQRPPMNGLKINDHLFALDYNMQSEFSDRSTFIHEFGHSLTLPDVYDMRGTGNSSGEWEIMSGTSHLQAQEMSSYSKISLGWIEPKIVRQGQETSAYIGAYNFVTSSQRDENNNYSGPEKVLESFGDSTHSYDVVSLTPGFGEAVYRSVVALMNPTIEERSVMEVPTSSGTYAAYSGKFDSDSRSLKLTMRVPDSGDAILTFDQIHHVETETNFDSNDATVRVTTDFDLGYVLINGQIRDELRLISGDANFNSLAEAAPDCEEARVLELRSFRIARELTSPEEIELEQKLELCRKPQWVARSYDLSLLRGQDVEVEIRYTTDAGYTEFGIVVDNFKLGGTSVDFEGGNSDTLGTWSLLKRGKTEVRNNQFYMFEYRAPGENFIGNDGLAQSLNMDNNIGKNTQAMFQSGTGLPEERFRMIETSYQPGVLVWYFNSKFDRRSNSPTLQGGKGYLLVLNSRVGDIKLPGALGRADLFDSEGSYATESPVFKDLVKEQTRLFKCFSAINYYTYVDGEAPECSDVVEAQQNRLRGLKFGDRLLVERREGFNDFLPEDQYGMYGVGIPMRLSASTRTGLSTFRPSTEPAFRPIKVFKAENGTMVEDPVLTQAAPSFAPVARFRDADNAAPANSRFLGDSVLVEKKGFGFDVVAPAPRITQLYRQGAEADANENFYRRPRAKILFRWQ
jgi:M6 family metalloprotease-like protein